MGRHGSPARTTAYLKTAVHGHPMTWDGRNGRVHRVVLYDKIGPGWHPCHWCGKRLAWKHKTFALRIVADHIDGQTWNNTPKNLVPSCRGCNVGRNKLERSHCKNGHAWTKANTYRRPDTGTRACRACAAAREARRVRK